MFAKLVSGHRTSAVRSAISLAGLCLTLAAAGCSSGSAPAFDLSAPHGGAMGRGFADGQLVIAEPVAIAPLEAERILARDAAGSISYISDAQWADRLPRLFQIRLIEAFENNSRLKIVGRPGEGINSNYQLNSEIRAFGLDAASREAVIIVTVKVLNTQSGKVVAGKIFQARTPVPSTDGPTVAQALDRTFQNIQLEIVRWSGRV